MAHSSGGTGGGTSSLAASVLSVALHGGAIALLIGGSGATLSERGASITPVFYLPPPIHSPADLPSTERLTFVAVGAGGGAGGDGGNAGADAGSTTRGATDRERDSEAAMLAAQAARADDEQVFTIVEVDEEAVRTEGSAAPAYPAGLLAEGIEGYVIVRYVVEASGRADSSSLAVLASTHTEFADAVREALPYMRFTPARINGRPVRQLVEQPFRFRIQRPTPVDPQ